MRPATTCFRRPSETPEAKHHHTTEGAKAPQAPGGPGTEWTLLKADVTKTHRRIKVFPADWRFQVAQIDEEWWINKVGYAQPYWGRMAALLPRIVYYAFAWLDWGFVFVDDFLWLLRKEHAPLQSTEILLLLLAMGTPLSWKKTVLFVSSIWLGFQVDPSRAVITLVRETGLIIMALLETLARGEVLSNKAIEKALQCTTSACPMTRVWKQACRTAGRPPKLVRMLAIWPMEHPAHSVQPLRRSANGGGERRERDGEAYIGGWLTDQPNPTKGAVHWFHICVNPSWAHGHTKKGAP